MVVTCFRFAYNLFKKMNYVQRQAEFYDEHPPLVPWPRLLVEYGLSCLYKPREVFWKKELDRLNLSEGEKVLDVGCGQGLLLSRLSKTYKIKGVGIDVSEKSIQSAKKNFGGKNLSFKVAEAARIPFPNSSFDAVVSFDALEHIRAQEKAVAEMVRVLKPGGSLLVYTLNKNDKLTLNWIWEKLGFDVYSRAAHKRELFVDPNWLTKRLKALGTSITSLELFDAFFTLALDEAIMVLVFLFKKSGLFRNRLLGKLFFYFSNLVSRASFPLLQVFDLPWYKSRRSLSFLIIAKKETNL